MKPHKVMPILWAAVLLLSGCVTPEPFLPPEMEPVTGYKPMPQGEPNDTPNRIRHALRYLNDCEGLAMLSTYTRSVNTLIAIGEPAIEPTLPYLLSENERTRENAQTAIDGIISSMHGFESGHGWTSEAGHEECNCVWRHLGYEDVNARLALPSVPAKERMAFIERVRAWQAERRTAKAALCGAICIPPT